MGKISQIKQLMNEACERFLSVEHLCEQIDVSYHTFRKVFRRNEGVCLSEFLQQCRLQKAEALLSDRDKCIFEVAYEMSFSSDAYFTNWFKKQTGMTPTEFRKHLHHKKD